jgi:pimeloyl-ACP methyl ester carboxylesterase
MRKQIILSAICLFLAGCNFGRAGSTVPPIPGKAGPSASGKFCGDGVCDGPENAGSCPQDCASATAQVTETAPQAGSFLPGPEEDTYWMVNPASGAKLFVVVSYPEGGGDSPLAAIIMIPGGLGAKDLENGTDSDTVRLAAAGYAVIQFDADGRGSSGGNEDYNGFVHQDGLAALILAAGQIPRVDPARLGVISRSYGVTMAAGTLGRHPDLPVRFYIDWEGPADRYYTTSGCTGVNHGIEWPACSDSAFWSEREAVNFIGSARIPYQRIQSAKDHVQSTNAHAVDMINAAVRGGVPWVRLNDGPVNQTYDPAHPPEMFPDTIDRQLADLFVRYAGELFSLEW